MCRMHRGRYRWRRACSPMTAQRNTSPISRRTTNAFARSTRTARRSRWSPTPKRARTRRRSIGRATSRRSQRSLDGASSRTTISRNWRTTSTGRRSSRPGIWPAPIRRSSMTRSSGNRRGVLFLLPANTVNDDDIEIYTDDTRTQVAMTWRNLRQQTVRPIVDGVQRANRSLADFIAPKDSGVADYIGMFAVTAGLGVEKKEKQFEADNDDYSAIM